MDLGGPKYVKVVLIQKDLLDNWNPGFCMGWPGLYLLDNIDQLGTVFDRDFLNYVHTYLGIFIKNT